MDRIKKDQELRERITGNAYVENSNNKPVTDGPIDPERFYTTTKARTVFYGQEPYGDNGGWDMSESLRRKRSLLEQPRKGKPTIGAILKTASKLNDREEEANSMTAYDNFKETVGWVNVKKEPNTTSSKSNHATLKKHADKNRSILKEQYDNMNLSAKDTVILAGTKQELVKENGDYVEIFGRKFFKKDIFIIKKGRQEYIKYNNKDGGPMIISAPHPASARFGKGNFADNIKEIRNCKEQQSYQQNTNGSSTSSGANIIDACANACRSSIKYIKNNPKKTTIIVCGVVVVLTGGFLLYRKFKKKR